MPRFAATTIDRDRKALLRTLLEEVIIAVERAAFLAHLTLRWRADLLSELDVPLPRSRLAPVRTDEETVTLLRRLGEHDPDAMIAVILNRQERRTATDMRFAAKRVSRLHTHRQIPRFEPHAQTGLRVSS